jgi:pimeloyl-ACP methyl ester carboxylesterase
MNSTFPVRSRKHPESTARDKKNEKAMATTDYRQHTITVGGAKISYLKGGTGRPLVALHSVEGNLGWLRFYDDLARKFTVFVPTHPGFAGSDRPDWLEGFLDLSRFYLWILQALELDKATLLGHFVGGWLAAEIAVMSPQLVERMVLVDAAGVRPKNGELTDIFLHGTDGARKLSFFDVKQVADYELLFGRKPSPEEREAHVINREAATRYCWKPYMHDPSLPALLPRLRGIPTLIVWGREDNIAPLECGTLYKNAIDGARLEVIDRCGHFPQLERTADFTRIVTKFLAD